MYVWGCRMCMKVCKVSCAPYNSDFSNLASRGGWRPRLQLLQLPCLLQCLGKQWILLGSNLSTFTFYTPTPKNLSCHSADCWGKGLKWLSWDVILAVDARIQSLTGFKRAEEKIPQKLHPPPNLQWQSFTLLSTLVCFHDPSCCWMVS
jgi:hypothetical protein